MFEFLFIIFLCIDCFFMGYLSNYLREKYWKDLTIYLNKRDLEIINKLKK